MTQPMDAAPHTPMSVTANGRAGEARTLAAMCAQANAVRRTLLLQLGGATPTRGEARPAARRLVAMR